MDKTCIIWCTGWWPVHHPTSALRQTTSRWQHYEMRPPPISLLAQKAGDIHEASSRHLLHATACDIHVECARRSRAKVDAPLPKRPPPNQEQDPLEGCETLQMRGRDAVGAATARAHEGRAGSRLPERPETRLGGIIRSLIFASSFKKIWAPLEWRPETKEAPLDRALPSYGDLRHHDELGDAGHSGAGAVELVGAANKGMEGVKGAKPNGAPLCLGGVGGRLT